MCKKTFVFLYYFLLALHLYADEIFIDPVPINVIINPCSNYTLINSVNFHPQKNLFCVTYTQGNRVVLYDIDKEAKITINQSLYNPLAKLREPQHAVFSPLDEKLAVVNWTTRKLNIYAKQQNNLYFIKPATIISAHDNLSLHRPHGVSFSPCGKFLAIAYGVSSVDERAIALFRMKKGGKDCELASVLQGAETLYGVPKGIVFSPDGTCLLVTFSDSNSLVIFDLDLEKQVILPSPRQVIQGHETKIFRPEDVKLSPDGNYCAVTNSDHHTVTFYSFEQSTNSIKQTTPSYTLKNPEAKLCFPHGISFSPDGSFFLVTQFGPISTTNEGGIYWDNSKMSPKQAKINVYRTSFDNAFKY